jgi:hypothetical protein
MLYGDVLKGSDILSEQGGAMNEEMTGKNIDLPEFCCGGRLMWDYTEVFGFEATCLECDKTYVAIPIKFDVEILTKR